MAKGKNISPGSGGPAPGNPQRAQGAKNGVGTQNVYAAQKSKNSTRVPVGKRGRR